jgi:hypothetical protein
MGHGVDQGKAGRAFRHSPLPLAGEAGAAQLRRVRVACPKRDSMSNRHPHPNPLPPAGEGAVRYNPDFRQVDVSLVKSGRQPFVFPPASR